MQQLRQPCWGAAYIFRHIVIASLLLVVMASLILFGVIGFDKYKGGLDTVHDLTGTHSVYTHWRGIEIMFHVSTLLPYEQHDPQKVSLNHILRQQNLKKCINIDLPGRREGRLMGSPEPHLSSALSLFIQDTYNIGNEDCAASSFSSRERTDAFPSFHASCIIHSPSA